MVAQVIFNNMNNIVIHDFNQKHIDRLLDLIRFNTPKFFAAHEEQEFKDYLENHTELYYVYEKDGTILGCGGVNFSDDKKEAFMSWGMVHPDFQGKGIGTIMTNHRLDILKKMTDLEKITLKTSQKTNVFYEKLGFETVFTKKDFWAKGLDLVQMEYFQST
jgi:ribosomal protein S18 acetylase RimI-like enzyme